MNKFIIGLVIGIAIAGGLAIYLNNAPTQFVQKNVTASNAISSSGPIILSPGAKIKEAPAGGNSSDGEPRAKEQPAASAPTSYDFYDVLQAKKASNTASVPVNQPASSPKASKFMVQAGAFSDESLASDMRGKLALLGIDSTIVQTNGVYRVLIGPVSSDAKAQKIINQLSDQQINAVLIKINK